MGTRISTSRSPKVKKTLVSPVYQKQFMRNITISLECDAGLSQEAVIVEDSNIYK